MTKKDEFVKYVEKLMENQKSPIEMTDNVRIYWEAFLGGEDHSKTTFTDNGKLIMEYLQKLPKDGPMLKAKDIAEGMFISSRAVSGAIRKLVTDGYVEKAGQDPVMYALTDEGRNVVIE